MLTEAKYFLISFLFIVTTNLQAQSEEFLSSNIRKDDVKKWITQQEVFWKAIKKFEDASRFTCTDKSIKGKDSKLITKNDQVDFGSGILFNLTFVCQSMPFCSSIDSSNNSHLEYLELQVEVNGKYIMGGQALDEFDSLWADDNNGVAFLKDKISINFKKGSNAKVKPLVANEQFNNFNCVDSIELKDLVKANYKLPKDIIELIKN